MDGTGRLFSRLVAALPRQTTTVMEYPAAERLDYDALESWIAPRLIEISQTSPVAIVGESFSGPLALRLATRFPERVRAVIMVASFIKPPRFIPPFPPLFFRLPPPRFALRRWLCGDDADDGLVDEVASAIQVTDPRVLAHRLGAVRHLDAADLLSRCPAPVLFLAGARDRVVSIRAARRLTRVRPELELQEMDAPHLVLQRRPRESASAILQFVERHTRDTR